MCEHAAEILNNIKNVVDAGQMNINDFDGGGVAYCAKCKKFIDINEVMQDA